MSRRVMGPFNRVEGDLAVELDIDGDVVRAARVISPLYRGFEQMLLGRDPRDILVYTPRICGICSVSQSVAAAEALAAMQGLERPPNGDLATNLILACENVADHLTHFYLFFMPDFAREVYARRSWYAAATARFRAVSGEAAREALQARAAFLQLMGLLAGKWPHSLSLQPGGSTRSVGGQEKARILAILYAFRRFLESRLYGGNSLECIVALESADALSAWVESAEPQRGDLRHFLVIARDLALERLGRASDVFMSYGAYRWREQLHFSAGVWSSGEIVPLDPDEIREDHSHSWLGPRSGEAASARHPYEGVTLPDADVAGAYTWCKAPRLAGRVVEVGALARQLVDGHPLLDELVKESGGNVRNRVVARLMEIARVVIAMEEWARALTPGEPFCHHAPQPEAGCGYGLVEAARGSLGHWLRVEDGRILNYQIIAPTTWNFSPRSADGTPGALEQALAGTPVYPGETEPVAVQHIVRSFDPCMVCTVH